MHPNGTNVKMEHAYLQVSGVMVISIVRMKTMRTIVQIMCHIMKLPNARKISSSVPKTAFVFRLNKCVMARNIVGTVVTKLLVANHCLTMMSVWVLFVRMGIA